jgi:tetratricopeptide (TPR) repeat protein
MRRTFAALLVVAACGGPAAQTPHEVDLSRYLPATLEATHPKQGDPRPVQVRVWVDQGIRALPHWKEDITDQLDYAGQLLTPLLGIRLQVAAWKTWDRTGAPDAALADLAKADDGKDATWVIGYVTPPDDAHTAMSELGNAKLLGHYVIVRGWPDKAETDKLAARLPDLPQARRAEVIAAYRRHEQAVVLLHMLGVTLGAIAESDPSWIGNPAYSPKQSTFSDRDRQLMQIAIDGWLDGGKDADIAHDLLENIESADWGGWIAGDHDDVVKELRNVVDAAKVGKTAADVPVAAYNQFDRVRQLRARGEAKEALIELDNLMTAYPGNATMLEEKCEIQIDQAGVADKDTRATCARVSELAPGDPSPHLAVGAALAKAHDLAGAHAELELAKAKIKNLTTGQADAWHQLIDAYQKMDALTWTEDAIAAAGLPHDPAGDAVAQDRARFGIPRGAKFVKPDGEPALVAAVRGALDLVYAGHYPDAARAIDKAERTWRGAPGLAAARCDLELREGRVDAARAQCRRALASDPDESWARYLGGVIDLREAGTTRAGIAELKRAIAIDPALAQAWHALGQAYARVKDQTSLDQLAKDYAARFGQPLPQ